MKKPLFALALLAAAALTFAADSVSRQDKQFLDKAATGGMFEVEAGKLAESKGHDGKLKEFGAMLVKDHSAANDELKALAQKKGVALPTALPKDMQKTLDKLAKAKDFDKEFVKEVGLDDHRKDIALFEKTSKGAKDPDVKAFATKALPTLKEHLHHAEELSKAMKSHKKV